MNRTFFDPALLYVGCLALVAAVWSATTVPSAFRLRPSGLSRTIEVLGGNLVCALITWLVVGRPHDVAVWTALFVTVSVVIAFALPQLTGAGVLEMALTPLMLLVGLPWSWLLVRENSAAGWAVSLSAVGAVIAGFLLCTSFAFKLLRQALMTHATWRRPTRPPIRPVAGRPATVSIHLCAYSEPPEVVMAVLDRLARLDYDDYEVLVCDNNTEDSALWRPVERHCAQLNRAGGIERFRFFHVAPLAGAKAGALNFLLERTAQDTDLIGVIDADYLAEPDFLARLVGFFDDPQLGFVQTSHDYRQWQDNAYLRACYWQYMAHMQVDMPGFNEYGAAYTVGTMCLFRADGLRAVGGWAEWCLTEDSEVSVRLQDLGFKGIFLRNTFGRGLIPQTFDDLKKQRFRWSVGPSQQLRRHWRLYLPRALGGSARIGVWSKLLELQHGAGGVLDLVQRMLAPVGMQLTMIAVAVGAIRPIHLPPAAWLAVAVMTIAQVVATWHKYHLAGCRTLLDMVWGEAARLSLTFIELRGGVSGLSSRPQTWRRTPKFAVRSRGLAALRGTWPETAVALLHGGLAVEAIVLREVIGPNMVLAVVTTSLVAGSAFLSAPLMALLSERRLVGARAVAPDAHLSLDPPSPSPSPGHGGSSRTMPF